MKYKLIIIFLLFLSKDVFGQTNRLFRIVENERVGYIDKNGKVIIQPKYKNGFDFSEELAPVRLNGKYGFIDKEERFVIQPKYDFATSFYNGIACVYLDGKPSFINKNDKIVLGKQYTSITFINQNLAIVGTPTSKKAIIDLNLKKLLTDTIYNSIGEFKNGIAVVGKLNKKKKNNQIDYAVIDSVGNYIVPFGKYEEIHAFVDGYARVAIYDKSDEEGSIDGVIDSKGNLLFQRPYLNGSYISDDFHDGLALVYLHKEKKDETSTDDSYQGYINLKGEIVLNDTINDYLKNFSFGRTFIEDKDDNYRLMDTKLNQVGSETFSSTQSDGFKNGFAIVENKNYWGIIDTNGKYVAEPKFDYINDVGVIGNYFFYATESDEDEKIYGLANINGTILTQPIIQEFDENGFVDGILKTIVNNRLTYIDTNGNIVWQERKTTKTEPDILDIDYMNRGYFYAYSKSAKGDLGGFGSSGNFQKEIKEEDFPKGKLSIVVTNDLSNETYKSYSVFISNLSNSNIEFSAQDSRLYMKVQAKDTNGKWKDIEYLPSSWCGNSYHTLTLEKNNYWKFQSPAYDGEYKTKLRIELKYIDPSSKVENRRKRKEITVYSNQYNGGVNPGQFWNKNEYYPQGIMDPYND